MPPFLVFCADGTYIHTCVCMPALFKEGKWEEGGAHVICFWWMHDVFNDFLFGEKSTIADCRIVQRLAERKTGFISFFNPRNFMRKVKYTWSGMDKKFYGIDEYTFFIRIKIILIYACSLTKCKCQIRIRIWDGRETSVPGMPDVFSRLSVPCCIHHFF